MGQDYHAAKRQMMEQSRQVVENTSARPRQDKKRQMIGSAGGAQK
jgi:hypothetical protein